jgi:hypothetical protein
VLLVDGGDPATDVGQFAAAQLDDSDRLHVVYQDALGDRLLYKRIDGLIDASMLPPEVVDDGVRDDGPHSVGAGASLLLDGDTVRVVYQDQLLSDLERATRDGAWSHADAQSGVVGYGWWPHLVDDDGKLYVSQFVFDRSAKQVGAFKLAPMP